MNSEPVITPTGQVFDIQRFCIHDGPGIRTTVFLKGCPLSCRWCSNPESQRFGPEMFWNAERCMSCGACVAACPSGAMGADARIRRDACVACGNCGAVCPMAALVGKGRGMTVAEVMREVERDRAFYASSGGGATVSGGEPFGQPNFLFALLSALRTAGIGTAVESCAHAEWDAIERCLPLLDHLMIDVKHTDTIIHEEWTGVGLERIRVNTERIVARRGDVLFRIPVIPGFNGDADAAEGFADFFEGLEAARVELLPYHGLGEGKYGMLDRDYPGATIPASEAFAVAERLRDVLIGRGIAVEIGG
ncbi:MAG: glycyl-radical enzyme activating protein [Planctomycetota bacterium]|jgi:pyruvate formate lyase activating enzyme|nr:glycyl-radical enzyme activating protein [Planctomycetota bacterium]